MLAGIDLLKKTMPAQRNGIVEILPHWKSVDVNLNGSTRFCYGIGNSPALLTSDNSFTVQGIYAGNSSFTTTDKMDNDCTNCIVSIDASEHVLVTAQDSATDSDNVTTTTFSISNAFNFPHEEGVTATILAFNVDVTSSDVSAGAMSFDIATTRLVVAGDNLGILLNDDFQPTLSPWVVISDVVCNEYDAATDITYYTITLATPLPYDLGSDGTLYIEAKPAYESWELKADLPSVVAVDVHGGETLGKGVLTATYKVTTYSTTNNVLKQFVVSNNDVIAEIGRAHV